MKTDKTIIQDNRLIDEITCWEAYYKHIGLPDGITYRILSITTIINHDRENNIPYLIKELKDYGMDYKVIMKIILSATPLVLFIQNLRKENIILKKEGGENSIKVIQDNNDEILGKCSLLAPAIFNFGSLVFNILIDRYIYLSNIRLTRSMIKYLLTGELTPEIVGRLRNIEKMKMDIHKEEI